MGPKISLDSIVTMWYTSHAMIAATHRHSSLRALGEEKANRNISQFRKSLNSFKTMEKANF